MRAFLSFTKKEWVEGIRTYKALILGAVFLLFGFMNPIAAKVTPELLKALLPEGMILNLPEPSALDSWLQFYKNTSQMGMAVLIILFSGITANELSKGTLVNMLTKGLSMKTVILSKYTAATIFWTLAYVLCATVTAIYTAFFWENHEMPNLMLSLVAMWCFGELVIALSILGGILTKTVIGSLLLTGGAIVLLLILNINPNWAPYNPVTLVSANAGLVTKTFETSDMLTAMSITVLLNVVILFSANMYSKKVTQ